ncbi:PREDICTED: poly(A)-specific ribonuclease PARN-like isoform X2 [Papilio polytes]|uniref:poly(A)-specific ribonuclease PARN-like isoform X2 n=1 Tax=Papilio polytes TaxID=76194 RepID=UPI000676361C|nr:PREDICTED: poly(A)-specific ribonuclease PARN-like isoform X2 [Papilio polytes]
MEVTRNNFRECLPLIDESIKKADFLVIDAEFTGIINGRDVTIFDTPQEYYVTLLKGSTDFLIIQYGLCAFYWNEAEKHYMNDAYNFYLFPRGRPGPEKVFLCQSSSLDFLSCQGFDFNKLIKEGISYMNEPAETRLRENLTERQKSYVSSNNNIPIPDENKQQIEDICKKVRAFLDEKKDDTMEIDRCNAFIRRLLFQELGNRFKKEVFVETKMLENKSRVLMVSRLKSEAEGRNRDTEKKDKEWEEFDEAVGFSKVMRMISQSQKLIIGHNMLLDVMHTLNHFFQPLPADYKAFKEFAHCMFPRLLDTKYMSSLPPFKDKVNSSVLEHLLATLSEPPFSLPKAESVQGRGYRRADDKLHEAGYDAYVTGLCFLAMHQHLARMRGDRPLRLPGPDCAALKPFLNKLFLAKTAHQDSPYMNLTGADPTPSRDHVFYLTFPEDWQRSDISQLFNIYGPVTVQFLDETSALVALVRREQARAVRSSLDSNKRVSLVPYVTYKAHGSRMPGQMERPQQPMTVSTPDLSRVRQGKPARARPSPEQFRARCNSMSSPPEPPPRKRTSSGVFQVDELEPPTKKPELTGSSEEAVPAHDSPLAYSNGRRKAPATDEDKSRQESDSRHKSDNHIVDKFDNNSTSSCVTAFKESDSWD